MRTRLLVMVAALLLVSATAESQTVTTQDTPKTVAGSSVADVTPVIQVDFGFRLSSYGTDSDEARHQRFQDLRNGAAIDRFRLVKQTESWSFNGEADRVGYRDQRYYGLFSNPGKLKVSFEWNQTPLFYSRDTRTFYVSSPSTPGVLRVDDSIQSGIQNATLTLPNAAGLATPFDLRSQRDVADLRAVVSAGRRVDLNLYAKTTYRVGQQPFGAGFGFTLADEVPLPVDSRTTELGGAFEWANGRSLLRLGYDGSFYRNNAGTLVWDNPLRIADSIGAGPYQGRMALWPNSAYNTVSATASVSMVGRSQAVAYLAVGNMTQNDPLIPFTINTALPSIELARPTANAQARVTSANLTFTSRPTDIVWFSARFRSYGFINRTPEFHVGNLVNYDTSVVTLNEPADPLGFSRKTFDAEASVTPMPFTAFRVGYTREAFVHRFRTVETTRTDTVQASIDTTGLNWLTLRAIFEHGNRTGTGLDVTSLIERGEQPSLREFDIADRDTDRFSAIIQVMPMSQFSVNAMVASGKETYPDTATGFGLRSNDNRSYSIGFDFVPTDAVSMGLSYQSDKYTAVQWSRTASPLPSPQFNDPTRNWSDNSSDRTDTVTASLDLLKLFPKTELRTAYDYSKGQSTYVYGLASNTTLPAPVQLAPVVNTRQHGTLDLRYLISRHVSAGVVYWYDKYDVNDYALGPATIDSIAQPSFLALGYVWRPYTAQTVWARLSFLW
jgi:MtrB/PioB family decaheme-associated outer membrane protein